MERRPWKSKSLTTSRSRERSLFSNNEDENNPRMKKR